MPPVKFQGGSNVGSLQNLRRLVRQDSQAVSQNQTRVQRRLLEVCTSGCPASCMLKNGTNCIGQYSSQLCADRCPR